MMKDIFNNKYQLITYCVEDNLMEFSWHNGVCSKLNDEKYISEVKIGADLIIKLKPTKVLVHYGNFNYPISPDVQEEVNDIILPAYYIAQVKKLAFLSPSDMIDRWAIEQIIEERIITHTFKTKLFSNENAALVWLNK